MSTVELATRYRLERRLGAGAMATVHLAHDTVLDRVVVVKLLRQRQDAGLRARFVREGLLAAGLSHPNVVAVFDAGEEDGQPYIVMEYVEGESLAELTERCGRLGDDEVRKLGSQAAAGLAHAHAHGVVHRDVKPQNLLLRADGLLKVADFGIARGAGGTITEAGTILGTAGYIPPELIAGEPATAAADVYSLGAVLYELLAGRPPREVTSLADVERRAAVRPLEEAAPETAPELARLVARCLSEDPEERPSAAEVAADLEAGSSPADAPTRVAAPPARRGAARRWWPVGAVTAAAVLAAAALALAVSGGRDDAPPSVAPVPSGTTPAGDARALAEWLRANASEG